MDLSASTARRLAVLAPDEAAIRLVRAVHDLGSAAPRVVLLSPTAERRGLVGRVVDEVVALDDSDVDGLERALVASRADALWPGWGPAAEDPEIAACCERLGVTFLGPPSSVLRLVRDRVAVKRLAEGLGVPVVPWSGRSVDTVGDALEAAAALGFPVMLKAAAGGGAAGIHRVDSVDELTAVFEQAQADAATTFGDATLYVDALIGRAGHLEVPVLADEHGRALAFGVHDATLRRRGDKVLLESAAPALPRERAETLADHASRLVAAAGYRGAATVAFLHDPAHDQLLLLEVYPRLPPEHALAEAVRGIDLVGLQLAVGLGGRLPEALPPPSGHAMQARLNAEDPERGFRPAPGPIARLRHPGGPGVRVDAAIAEGDDLGDRRHIASVLAWGPDRETARVRLQRALLEMTAVVDGGSTNKGFLLELLDRPEVRSGAVDNTLVDRLAATGELSVDRDADLALLVAAIDAYEAERLLDQGRFLTSARRGRPEVPGGLGRTIELRRRGQGYDLVVARTGRDRYRIAVDGARADVRLERIGPFESRLHLGERPARVVSIRQGGVHLVEVDGTPHRFRRDEGGIVRAASPGVVVALAVTAGQEVGAGEPLAVIESMKMEWVVPAPFAGRVRHVFVTANVQVDTGAQLVQLDPIDAEDADEAPGPRIAITSTSGPAEGRPLQRCARDLEGLRELVLGYDLDAAEGRSLTDDLAQACQAAGPAGSVQAGEHELLTTFADLRLLFRGERESSELDVRAPQEHLHAYVRALETEAEGLPSGFVAALRRALAHYGVTSLTHTAELEEALYWVFQSQQRVGAQVPVIVAILRRWLDHAGSGGDPEAQRRTLDHLVNATQRRFPVVADLAREVRFRLVDEPILAAARDRVYAEMDDHLDALAANPDRPDRQERIRALVECSQPLAPLLLAGLAEASGSQRRLVLEVMTRRYYRLRALGEPEVHSVDGHDVVVAPYVDAGRTVHVLATAVPLGAVADGVRILAGVAGGLPTGDAALLELYAWTAEALPPGDALATAVGEALMAVNLPPSTEQVVIAVAGSGPTRKISAVRHLVYRLVDGQLAEDTSHHGLHPMMAERLSLWRAANFALDRLPSSEDVYLFRGVAHSNPKDERLLAIAEVRDLTPALDDTGRVVALPELERVLLDSLEGMRRYLAPLPPERRLHWNRVMLYVWPPLDLPLDDLERLARGLAPLTVGLGLEEILVSCRRTDPATGQLADRVIRLSNPAGTGFVLHEDDPPTEPLQPLDEYTQKVVSARRRGAPYPYELVKLLTAQHAGNRADVVGGSFVEHDLDADGRLVPVDRPPGRNTAGIVVGVVTTTTERVPEGMTRVILLGDPTKALGSLAEPECRRIMAGLDLAESMGVPLEWFALSAGARIAMDSGSENMDWISAVLRRIIEFTQVGHEVNVVVTGINVGAQPYWNAEATMLMHTKGILVMTPDSAMVLTGKQALDYSGSVSADDNLGIGGYERVMGPNGQAQYWAPHLEAAIGVLLAHYDHAYVVPGERFPRRAHTADPFDRDVRSFPHRVPGIPFTTVGDIFSDHTNPGRKQPFDIRTVMRSVTDQDHEPLERWRDLRDADTVVVWDAHVGGWPVCMIGIEGRALPRRGQVPADGPLQWTSGTFFPMSSKKTARAVNAASGNRPLVVMANLSGFDGSPESMRSLQLEFGAEIGRAVVNFRGPIVFCVPSRFHGGAFVVFSQRLNESLEIIAVEGAHASVIGGAPAAAVVFAGEVDARTRADGRVKDLEAAVAAAEPHDRARLRAELDALRASVRSEKLGEVADEYDRIHSVDRAQRVGSVRSIIPPHRLRPHVIEALERGIARELGRA